MGMLSTILRPFRRYPSTAAEWAVRTQAADMSKPEQRALDAWLKSAPDNAAAFAKCHQIGHLAAHMKSNADLVERMPAYTALKRVPQHPTSALRGSAVLAGGFAVVAVAAIVWIVRPAATQLGESRTYTTAHGEQRTVPLTDGSRIYINTSSKVIVKFDGSERRVELTAGEAFFDVSKDAKRPFIVAVGTSEVLVTGTKFGVRQDATQTRVVVTEGKVDVVPNTARYSSTLPEKIALSPGESLRYDLRQERVQVGSVDAERATAWRIGSIDFDNASLEDVIAEVNRYTQKTFVIDREDLKSIRLSGRFKVGDIDSVIFALRDGFNVESEVRGRQVFLLRR